MKLDFLRWIGLATLLAAAALWLVGERTVTSGPAQIERLLVYDLREPITFKLEADERTVRLVSWLAAPAEEAPDVRRSELYALALQVRDLAGNLLLEREIWIPTHQSRLSVAEPVPPQRAPGGGLQPWDDRNTAVDVAGIAPGGGTLTVTVASAPPGTTVYGIAFRRSVASRLAVFQQLQEPGSGRSTLAPWDASALPLAWRERAASAQWDRLGALPQAAGGLLETVRLETWFDRLSTLEAPASGTPIAPGQALVWLIRGPTDLVADVRLPDGRESPEGLVGRLVQRDGLVVPWRSADGPLRIPDLGELAVTLEPGTVGLRVVRAETQGGEGPRNIGDPPRIRRGDREQVAPDLRELQAWRVDPALEPVRFDLVPGEEVRITGRAALGPGPFPGLDPAPSEGAAVVSVTALDARGAETGAWTFAVDAIPSAFERYVRGDARDARTSEPGVRYLFPPRGSTTLVIEADRPLDVNLDTSPDTRAPWVAFPAYTLPVDMPSGLLYEPYVELPWRALAPTDVDRLTRTGRSVAIDAQVRLAPLGSDGSDAGRIALLLPGPFQILAEPNLDGAGAGGRVRLGASAVTVRIPPSGVLSLDYRVAATRVGADVQIRVGARTVTRKLLSAGGSLRVDDGGAGPQRVSVDVPGLFLARGEGGPAWQARRAWPLGAGREIAIPAGEGALTVYAYRADRGTRARWTVEELGAVDTVLTERPSARDGGVVEGWVARPLAEPLSYAGGALEPMAPIHVARPPGSGPARLVIRPEGPGAVWLRASASRAQPASESASHARQGSDE